MTWEELTHWKRLWCWEGLGAGGEGDDKGWDGWMASRTPWTCIWVNSGRWWWTGRFGVLRFTESQRVRHDWATELNWPELTNSTVCLCEWMTCHAWNKWEALLCGSMVISYSSWQKPVGGLYRPANAKRHPMSPLGTDQKWAKRVDQTLLSWSNFLVFWPFHNSLGIRSTNLIYWIIDFQGAYDLYCYCVLWLRSQTWIGSQESA